MRVLIVGLVIALAVGAAAGTRKVIVLPVDGSAPSAQRTQINSAIVALSKSGIDGDISAGETTFADTAAAVGCAPEQPTCADTVLTTLSVDELVYGTATTDGTQTTVTIHRVTKGAPERQQVTVIPGTASGDQASAGLGPLFARDTAAVGSGSDIGVGSGSGSAVTPREHTGSFFDTRERKIGFAFSGGAVASLIVGFSLWASESSIQSQIDNHPTRTLSDLQDLHALEDRAGTKALWGNVFVITGVALGAVGGYYFYKDHKNRNATVLAPAPTESGPGVKLVLGGRW